MTVEFLMWRTIDKAGVISHQGTCQTYHDPFSEAAHSDRRCPDRAPHTVQVQTVEWRDIGDVTYGPWKEVTCPTTT